MTNKEIIKWLQSLKSEIGKQSNQHLWNYEEALDMAIKALQTEWIPVSERLPSESGWYFVTVQGMERVSDMVWYYHESHEWNGLSKTQKVLAWKPLPEPYKGGDEA